jgi:hypothetical protein
LPFGWRKTIMDRWTDIMTVRGSYFFWLWNEYERIHVTFLKLEYTES